MDNKDIPEIPDIHVPDPAAPERKRAGFLIAAAAGVVVLCCVATAGAGLALGAITLNGSAASRGMGTPAAEAQPLTPTGASILDKALESLAPSMTATPGPTPLGGGEAAPATDPATAATPAPEAGPTQTSEPTAPPITEVPRETTDRQLRVFSEFWQIVDDNYVYEDFNGMDWAGMRGDVEARIQQGMTDEAFYSYLGEWIVKLKDDHSFYLSPEEAREEDQEYNGTLEYAGVGIITELSEKKGYIVVLQVLEGGPAEQAGIRAHDAILQIDGQPSINEKGESQSSRLRGEPGTTVSVLVRSPGGEPRAVTLTRAQINAKERVEFRVIDSDGKRFGYVLIPTLFEEDIDERVRAALKELQQDGPLDGLIIDLRINGGGALDVLRPTLGFFTRGEIGRLVNRRGSRLAITVRAENAGQSQRLPLAVLIGPATESYAEVMAGALQAKGRAKLIGQNTAGNIETLRAREFEDGSRLWLAEESFKLSNGNSWEGVGLAPDITVAATWDEHTAENDPVIAQAVAVLSE